MSDVVPPSPARQAVDELPPPHPSRLALQVVMYAVARAVLVAALWLILTTIGSVAGIESSPVAVLLIAVAVALPISQFVFRRLRTGIRDSIAAIDTQRRQQRPEQPGRGPA